MGDIVNRLLEKGVSDLKLLERRGVFDAQELRQIVRRRRQFEQRMLRSDVEPKHYIEYVEYERLMQQAIARRCAARSDMLIRITPPRGSR